MRGAIAGVLGLVLVLGCANPVQVGIRGLETDVEPLVVTIEAGAPLVEEATALIQEAGEEPGEEFLPKIEELKGKIGEVVVVEPDVKKIADSLTVLEEHQRITDPLKERIATLKETVGGLTGTITSLKEVDTKLDEVKQRIEEEEQGGGDSPAPRRRIERRVR